MKKALMTLPVIGIVVAMLGASVFAASPSAGTHPISAVDSYGFDYTNSIIIIDGEDLLHVNGVKGTDLGISKADLQAEVDKINDKVDAAELEVVHTFGAYFAEDYNRPDGLDGRPGGPRVETYRRSPTNPLTIRVSYSSSSDDVILVLHFENGAWKIVGKADTTSSVKFSVTSLSPFAIVKASPASSAQTGEYASPYLVMVASALVACGALFMIHAKKIEE